MRTTIHIDDQLFVQAKAQAATLGVPVAQLIADALRASLRRREAMEQRGRVRLITRPLAIGARGRANRGRTYGVYALVAVTYYGRLNRGDDGSQQYLQSGLAAVDSGSSLYFGSVRFFLTTF